MFIQSKNIRAGRSGAMLLAVALVAGLSVPFALLPRAHAASDPPLPCAVVNYNGCTELSAIPPQDNVSVPPNIVLMLDDSGSMDWDYMPDWGSLPYNNNQAARDYQNNSLYYNPSYRINKTPAGYQPPPKADSTASAPDNYPASGSSASSPLTTAFNDGFLDTSAKNITTYQAPDPGGHPYPYYTSFATYTDVGPATPYCPGGYHSDGTQCIPNSLTPPTSPKTWQCPASLGGGSIIAGSDPKMCQPPMVGETLPPPYPAVYQCPSGYTWNGSTCVGPVPVPKPFSYSCPNPPGGSTYRAPDGTVRCRTTSTIKVFTIDTHKVTASGAWSYSAPYEYYVASGTNCSNLPASYQPRCINEGDTSGFFPDGTVAGPVGVPVGQNVANWFSYYRTRILMAKTGMMTAFSTLDARFRFGFGSINANGVANIPSSPTPYSFDDSMASGTGGSASNQLAVVQPWGDGSPGTQKANFWTWLANETAASETPLRKALNSVGQYYQTSQPWTVMSSDPGYAEGVTTPYACRASYAILTTDGFWNGDPPTGIGYAAGGAGPTNTGLPSGDSMSGYQASPPYSGGGTTTGDPSLADVATYYWENDLQSTLANDLTPSATDPAYWQHMTTFTLGLGFQPVGITPAPTPPATTIIPNVFTWAQAVNAYAMDPTSPVPTAIPGFSWATPSSNSVNNISDLAHAAVNGHGNFFNITSPDELTAAIASAIADIGARTIAPKTSGVNSSVLSLGAVSFSTGYNTGDWTGSFEAVALNTDGTIGATLWHENGPGGYLDDTFHSSLSGTWSTRNVWTDAYTVSAGVGTFSAFQFNWSNFGSLDATEQAGLQSPALSGGSDTLQNRIDFLLGESTYEGTLYRQRTSILGAILRSQPVYVKGATGNYVNIWPATAPESGPLAQSFDAFVAQQATQRGMVYIGANDGMLHAFESPVPTCTGTVDASGNCSTYSSPAGAGTEDWAFIPRAVYENVGNLTLAANFLFRPTVDATPVRRDVFFSDGGTFNNQWRTILVGGVGLGGRGVYALDVTTPTTAFSAANVLWEFDSDMPVSSSCVASYGSCQGTDLGYTLSQPNIGRLSNGKWVALVPNGYFPDCTTSDIPTADVASCQAVAAQVPIDPSTGNPYSALFVLDAQTGQMIAELKTPTNISGVTSFGLATPVLGDYQSDQIDDVAFAGDVQGNLWRFDLSDPNPANWTVTLVYQGISVGGHQGVQPITSMPHLFPDPTTNRFMVLFGTGLYLGVNDNSNTTTQALVAVRDVCSASPCVATAATTYTQSDLVQQYLHEVPGPAGSTLRCVTGSATNDCSASAAPVNAVPASAGGWFVNLYTTTSDGTHNDAGERVVVSPGAMFASNTVVFQTLITGSVASDICNPSTAGSIIALNAITGAPAGISSLGGFPIAGARIANAGTSGGLPVVSGLGGGQAYLPGATLAPGGTTPLSIDAPIWRRRSWQEIRQNP